MKRPVFRRSSSTDAPSSAESGAADASSSSESETPANESETEIPHDELPTLEQSLKEAAEASPNPTLEQAAVDAENVARLEAEAKENYDKYLRAVAELENYKKRAIRERSDLLKYAGENIARDLLEIVDNFQLALAQNVEGVNADFLKGIRMISDRLVAIMEQHSVRGESFLGKPFDPTTQQALASVPTADHSPNTVIEEFKRAYFFKDKLLRPAQVVVAISAAGVNPKPAGSPSSSDETETSS